MPLQNLHLIGLAVTSIVAIFFSAIYIEPTALVPWSNQPLWKEPFWVTNQRIHEEEHKKNIARKLQVLQDIEQEQITYAREAFREWKRWVLEGETSSLPDVNISKYQVLTAGGDVLTVDMLLYEGTVYVSDPSASNDQEPELPEVEDQDEVDDVEPENICPECQPISLRDTTLLEKLQVVSDGFSCRVETFCCWLTPAILSTGTLLYSWFLAAGAWLVIRVFGHSIIFWTCTIYGGWCGNYILCLLLTVILLAVLALYLWRRLKKLQHMLDSTQLALEECEEHRKRKASQYIDAGTQSEDIDDLRIIEARDRGIDDGSLTRNQLEIRLDRQQKENQRLRDDLKDCKEHGRELKNSLDFHRENNRNRASEREVEHLKNELIRLTNELSTSKAESFHIQRVETDNEKLRQERDAAKEQVARLPGLEQHLETVQREIGVAHQKHRDDAETIGRSATELQNLKASKQACEEEKAKLRREAAKAEKGRAQLQQELSDSNHRGQESLTRATAAESVVQRATDELARVSRSDTRTSAKIVKDLTTRVEDLSAKLALELARADGALSESQRLRHESGNLRSQLDNAQSKEGKLISDLGSSSYSKSSSSGNAEDNKTATQFRPAVKFPPAVNEKRRGEAEVEPAVEEEEEILSNSRWDGPDIPLTVEELSKPILKDSPETCQQQCRRLEDRLYAVQESRNSLEDENRGLERTSRAREERIRDLERYVRYLENNQAGKCLFNALEKGEDAHYIADPTGTPNSVTPPRRPARKSPPQPINTDYGLEPVLDAPTPPSTGNRRWSLELLPGNHPLKKDVNGRNPPLSPTKRTQAKPLEYLL